MSEIKFSIIVPVYNVQEYLPRCLKSISEQTYDNFEVILIDDGSTDESGHICDEFVKNDTRQSVIHTVNHGQSAARNCGLSNATGDYVLYVDSDDYIELNTLEEFSKVIKANNCRIDIVVGVARQISEKNISFQKHSNLISGQVYDSKDFVNASISANEWWSPAWLNVYRLDFLKENNLFFREGIIYEDIDLQPRLFFLAKKICYLDFCFYNYVLRSNSTMTTKNLWRSQRCSRIVLQDWFDEIEKNKEKSYKKKLFRWYTKIALAMIGAYKINKNALPIGFKKRYLITYAYSPAYKLKAILFLISPRLYYAFYFRKQEFFK